MAIYYLLIEQSSYRFVLTLLHATLVDEINQNLSFEDVETASHVGDFP